MPTQLPVQNAGAGKARNYGIDLLRIVAMLLIVSLHVLRQGGALAAVSGKGSYALQILKQLGYAGVGIYAMISGYVMLYSSFHPARFFELYLQVLVLGLFLNFLSIWLEPAVFQDRMCWWYVLLPLSSRAYWYFSGYVLVWLLSPLINEKLRRAEPRLARGLMWAMLLVLCVSATIGAHLDKDAYALKIGNTPMLLVGFYVVGACLRRGAPFARIRSPWLLLILLLNLGAWFGLYRLGTAAERDSFWYIAYDLTMVFYHPVNVITALSLVELFSRLRPRGLLLGLTKTLSPLSFGVYVIHLHNLVWLSLTQRFRFLQDMSGWAALPIVLGSILGLYLACSGLDWLRASLFRLLRVRPLLDRLEARLLGRNPP